jgi:8-oxo-dGTP pyrophosphatase MutT (NUDIX family)
MPSAYACVYYVDNNQTRNVITATKRQQARWLDWNGVDYKVPYSDPVQRSHFSTAYNIVNNPNQPVFPGGGIYNETPTACATREFLEETGVILGNYPMLQTTVKLFNVQGGVIQQAPFAFACVYFQVSQNDFNAILQEAQLNILANNHVSTTADDELASVTTNTAALANQAFIQANNPGNYHLSTSWFSAIATNVP